MKINKKIITAICLTAVLSGCVTYNGQLDTSVPMKEQVTLKIMLPLYLVSVNGNNVDVGSIGQPPFGYTTINLPVGEHNLDFEYKLYIGGDGGTISASGSAYTTYDFEPGYTYSATGRINYTSSSTSGNTTTSRGTLGVIIQKKAKEQSPVNVEIETGVLTGLSKSAGNVIGLDMGIQPIGVIIDAGKVSFGLNTIYFDYFLNDFNNFPSNPFDPGDWRSENAHNEFKQAIINPYGSWGLGISVKLY